MALTEHGFNWKTSASGLIIPAQADNPALGPGVVDVEFEHKTSGLAAGTYGDGSHYPAVTVDAYGHLTGVTLEASGGGGASLLFSSTLAAATASIDTGAGGIAGGYNIIEVFIVAATADSGAGATLLVTFNNDGGANYIRTYLQNINSTLTGGTTVGLTSLPIDTHGSGGSASIPGVAQIVVPGYALTTFDKTFVYRSGRPDATAANNATVEGRGVYLSTAAISQMKVAGSSANLKAGSSLFIYGR